MPETTSNQQNEPEHLGAVQQDILESLGKLMVWTPESVQCPPYNGDSAEYVAVTKAIYRSNVYDHGIPPGMHHNWSDNRYLLADWANEHRADVKQTVPSVGYLRNEYFRRFASQLTDTTYALAMVPETDVQIRFGRLRKGLLKDVLHTETLSSQALRPRVLSGEIDELRIQDIRRQLGAIGIQGLAQPFKTLSVEQKRDVIDSIGSDLLQLWRMVRPGELGLIAMAERPTLRDGYEELPRILDAATSKQDVMRIFLSDPAAYKALIGKVAHYKETTPQDIEERAALLAVGEQMDLQEGELMPKAQFVDLIDRTSKAIATAIYSQHADPKNMRISKWDTVNADVAAKLTKNFNGKITHVKLQRLPFDATIMQETLKGVVLPDDAREARRYILTADLKSSGRATVPSGIEFVIYYRNNLIFRTSRKPATGQQKVDAMIADAQENARIIEVEKIERAGSAGAPGTGKKR